MKGYIGVRTAMLMCSMVLRHILIAGQCREGETYAQIFIYGLRSVLGLRVGLIRRV